MKKRILMIGMGSNMGGVESYIINLFRNVNRDRYELYFFQRGKIAYYEELVKKGAQFIPISVTRHSPLKYIRTMNAIFKNYQFDVVYYNTCDIMSIDMLQFGKKNNVSVRIIHSHNSYNINQPNLLHKLTERWCRKNITKYATQLLACSNVAGEWMFEEQEFKVINNGINVRDFKFDFEMRDKYRKSVNIDNKYAVGLIGRLEEQKNPMFLVEIYKSLCSLNEQAMLLVVGEGTLEKIMKARLKKYGLEDNVIFLGRRTDVNKLLNAMDCLVLPSLFEGLPFVLVEAQTNGLPCVVSSNVSKESNITSEVEFVSLEKSVDEWANIINNVKLKHERHCYVEIMKEKKFDIKETVKEIEKYFEGN